MPNQSRFAVTAPRLVAGMLCTLVFTSGCGSNKSQSFARPPMPVETAVVSEATVADRFEAVGTLEAVEQITVVSQIDALVIALPFREGAPIAQGGLIAQLDDAQLKAEEARAEAVRDQRKINYDRVKTIVEQHAGAQQDLDDADAVLKMAEADLALVQARLAKTRIIAPFAGIVGARSVSVGSFLRVGDAITTLAQVQKLKVMFTAPERFYPDLHVGAAVSVSTSAYPDSQLTGTISVVEPVVDPSTRSVRIVAYLDNPEGRFRPGMSANVSATMRARANAILIPAEAIFVEGNQSLVYVVKSDSTVTRTPIATGTRQREDVEVLQGLQPGAQIVTAGHQKLYEGAKVLPVSHRKPDQSRNAGAPS